MYFDILLLFKITLIGMMTNKSKVETKSFGQVIRLAVSWYGKGEEK